MARLRAFALLIAAFSILAATPITASGQRYETLSGTIIRISDKHHLIVAERRTAGSWYVADTGKFRRGQRVTGTGTVDRHGVFFPRAIRVIGGSSIQPTPVPGALTGCTGYRWPIKIAADPGAPQIVSSPTPTTIGNLISLHKPPAAAIRNAPAETTTWQIANARLTLLYQEHDRDYHLVLQDNAGHHLIAEAPDPACARTSVLSLQLAHVRSEINARFGSLHGAMRPYVQVSASGVGFFDEYSGSAGQARNGIELHPLTAICFGANCALP